MGYKKCQALRLAFLFVAHTDRSHALRGNASMDALRPLLGRGASGLHSHAEHGNDRGRNIERAWPIKVCSLYR